ncbi:hypothetical protein LTR17_010337 [Elasticomyces elasticus]|nr:hypothetical protein LTR17_010337 [Elasticomyces elasticus]
MSQSVLAVCTHPVRASGIGEACTEEFALFTKSLEPLWRNPKHQEIFCACRGGCLNAIMLTLVLLTPSLRSLVLLLDARNQSPEDPECSLCTNIVRWLDVLFDPAQGFQTSALQRVYMRGQGRNISDFKLAHLFLQMPTVELLGCFNFGLVEDTEPWEIASMPRNELQSLSISRGWPSTADIVGILNSCIGLRKLHIECNDPYDDDDDDDTATASVIDLLAVLGAIHGHSDTLQDLHIHGYPYTNLIPGDIRGELSALNALEALHIDEELLIQDFWIYADLQLPPGLKILTIHGSRFFRHIPDLLLAVSRAQCQSLEELCVFFPIYDEEIEGLEWVSWLSGMMKVDLREQTMARPGKRSWDLELSVDGGQDYAEITLEVLGSGLLAFCGSYGQALDNEGIEAMREVAFRLRAEGMQGQLGGTGEQ